MTLNDHLHGLRAAHQAEIKRLTRAAADMGARRWLEQAEADRHGAQLLLDGAVYHLVCFLSQQVAEKAVKAFLYASGEEIVLGCSRKRCADRPGRSWRPWAQISDLA